MGRKDGQETVSILTEEYTHIRIAVFDARRQGGISRPWGLASFFKRT